MNRERSPKTRTITRVILYVLFTITTLATGFLSRSEVATPNSYFAIYGGDIFWAALVYWGIALLALKKRAPVPLTGALLFSFLIEFPQLNSAPWLMDLRATAVGALVLGHGFLYSDLICYTIGIISAFAIDQFLIRRLFGTGHSVASKAIPVVCSK